MPSPSPRRAERRDVRSAAPGGASAAGVARPSLHATITKIMSESVKLKEAAARFNRLREQLPTAAADRALCAALLADIKAQIAEDLGEDLGEAAATCGHAQQSVLAQIADDLGEANAYGHAQQPDALRAARVPAQARPSQRRAVLAPISEESFGTSRCAGPHGGHKACDVSASECIERFDSGLRMDRMSSSTLSSTSTRSAPSTPVVAMQAHSDPSASSSTRERTSERTSERERLDDAYHPSSLRDNGANSAAAQAECEGAAARVLARVSGEDAKDGDRRDCKACGASGELGRQLHTLLCRASQPSCPTAPSAACSGPAAACAEPCRPRSVPSVRVSLHTALPRAPGEKGLAAIASIERPEAGSLPRLRFRQGFTTLASFALDGKSITLWLAADPAGPHSNVEQITHWRNVPQGAQWLKLSCVQGGDLYVFAARGWRALLSHFYA